MRILTGEVIVLDVVDLHEHDRIVTYLTRDAGTRRGVARGARRKHSRFAGQLQPLATVRLTWVEKENRDLVRISSVESVRAPRRLQEDLEGILLGSYLADQVNEFTQENESSDHIYRLLESTVGALEDGVDRDLAMRYFETWVLRLSGVFPDTRTCERCGESLAGRGAALPVAGDSLICHGCLGQRGAALRIEDAALAALHEMKRTGLTEMAKDPPSSTALTQIGELAARCRRRFLQHELKSYEVMEKTLAQV